MSAADLEAARGRTVDDVATPGLRVLFCGINPGLLSAALGQHFARPGNRFWPTLHTSGWTPTRLGPDRQRQLLDYGLGITNIVARATARADELSGPELRAGAVILEAKVRRLGPAWLAVTGLGAYREAFGRPGATVGLQDHRIGRTQLWLLPNPSGLNAHYPLPALAQEFRHFRVATERPDAPGAS